METINGIEKLTEHERQNLLMALIPNLSLFNSKSGNEGTAFFVDKNSVVDDVVINDNLVIKMYNSKIDDPVILNGVFDKYCRECEKYHLKGYDIPKIYAWTIVSKPDHSGFRYYIMEQRVPGRELFLSNIIKVYDSLKNSMPAQEFYDVLQNPEKNASLYKKILSEYVLDFIEMNERIESMSDANLENFLEGVYGMFKEYHFAIPDVHARNVLFHNDNLKLIDLYLEKDEESIRELKMTPPESLLYARMISLFNYNGDLKKIRSNESGFSEINQGIELNEILCTQAIKKVIRVGSRLCKLHPDERWWKNFVARLNKILDRENAEEIIKKIEPTFM